MSVVERYLELGLRLGRHVPDFVDAYYGPPELRERIEREPPEDPAALVEAAAGLGTELDDGADGLEPQRARWLRAQVTGIECACRRLAGESMGYADEVELCFGVRPEHVPEDVFEEAHRHLDEALPGAGSVAERHEAWEERRTLPADSVADLLHAIADDVRAVTVRRIGLPAGESVELGLVQNEPWEAYNYYLGGLRSRVVVNTDLPIRASLVVTLVTHECYPGHHTERATKESLLVDGRGYLEETLVLIPTPQSLVSEAIAEVAAGILLGDDEHVLAAEHLAPVGLAREPEVAAAVADASDGSARRAHERGAPPLRGGRLRARGAGLPDALGTARAGAGAQGARVPDRHDLARVRVVLRRGQAHRAVVRRRRRRALPSPAHRAARAGGSCRDSGRIGAGGLKVAHARTA